MWGTGDREVSWEAGPVAEVIEMSILKTGTCFFYLNCSFLKSCHSGMMYALLPRSSG